MNRKTASCAFCKNSNLPSICPICVNYRLADHYNVLKSKKSHRDSLYSRLEEVLLAKGKADDQVSWRMSQNEKLARLREKHHRSKEWLLQGKAKVERMHYDLKVRSGVLESARAMGLCRISKLSSDWLAKAEEAFKVGECLDVKLIEVNEKGQLRLSRRSLLPETSTDNSSSEETSDEGLPKKVVTVVKGKMEERVNGSRLKLAQQMLGARTKAVHRKMLYYHKRSL